MLAVNPNWAETVTAIATAVGALGLLGAIGAAFLAAQQVRETRRSRHTQMAGEFMRRWSEPDLIETRRLVAEFKTSEDLSAAFQDYIATNASEAYVLYRELDYFEQLGALERHGAIDFEFIRSLVGPTLVRRWDLWEPSIEAMGGESVYPLFADLASRMRRALDSGKPSGR
jgi:hypothetical protein